MADKPVFFRRAETTDVDYIVFLSEQEINGLKAMPRPELDDFLMETDSDIASEEMMSADPVSLVFYRPDPLKDKEIIFEAPEPSPALVREDGSDTDYTLIDDADAVWVQVGNVSVYITRTETGVRVQTFPAGFEGGDPALTESYTSFKGASEAGDKNV